VQTKELFIQITKHHGVDTHIFYFVYRKRVWANVPATQGHICSKWKRKQNESGVGWVWLAKL